MIWVSGVTKSDDIPSACKSGIPVRPFMPSLTDFFFNKEPRESSRETSCLSDSNYDLHGTFHPWLRFVSAPHSHSNGIADENRFVRWSLPEESSWVRTDPTRPCGSQSPIWLEAEERIFHWYPCWDRKKTTANIQGSQALAFIASCLILRDVNRSILSLWLPWRINKGNICP
jgi:hypothetical protein